MICIFFWYLFSGLIGIQQIQEQRLISLVPHTFDETPHVDHNKSSHRKTKHSKCDSNKTSANSERRLPNDLDLSKVEHRAIYDEQYFNKSSGDTLSKKQSNEPVDASAKLMGMMQLKSPKRDKAGLSPEVEAKSMKNSKSKHHSNSSKVMNGSSSKPSYSKPSPKQIDLIVEQPKRFYCRDWAFRKLAQCLEQRPTSRTCGTLVLGNITSFLYDTNLEFLYHFIKIHLTFRL